MKETNTMFFLQNRTRTGISPRVKHFLLEKSAVLAEPTPETVGKLVANFGKNNERMGTDILFSPLLRDKLEAFHLGDLSKKSASNAKIVMGDPLFFSKLTFTSLTKLGYSDPEIALKIVTREIHLKTPENLSARLKSAMTLAKIHEIVALKLFELPEILTRLKESDFSALKEAYPKSRELHTKIDYELGVLAANLLSQKRPCSSSLNNPPPLKRLRFSTICD